MPIDEPVSNATVLFIAKNDLYRHWDTAANPKARILACGQCQDWTVCPQLDWDIEQVVTKLVADLSK